MNENIKKRLTKNQILTLPNILSFFRILLIPVIIGLHAYSYSTGDALFRYLSAGVIVLSALTDVLDGIIARHFNQITDFGKFIDPVADKLTQMAMVVCIALEFYYVFALLGLLIVKDILLFIWGYFVFKKTDKINSSRWFGKACTVIIYLSMFYLFIIDIHSLQPIVVHLLFAVCCSAVIGSTILYGVFYAGILCAKKLFSKKQNDEKEKLN